MHWVIAYDYSPLRGLHEPCARILLKTREKKKKRILKKKRRRNWASQSISKVYTFSLGSKQRERERKEGESFIQLCV